MNKPWFKNVIPHKDIREGNLDESVFAANLAEVALDKGPEVYRNPQMFINKTYFTAGIRTISTRVIKGLNGGTDAGDRVITLQTGFGGGKTHCLITLFHIANQGKKINSFENTDVFLKNTTINFPKANIAVFTNTTCDPLQGRNIDGLNIKTIWGEIAYQLGGKKAYEIIKENDQEKVCPQGLIKKVLETCSPALILIDELADYCVSASAVKTGGTTLADQTISFIQQLSQAVSETASCVMVATLPASVTEVASSEQGAQILNSLNNRLARVSADSKPVSDEEIFEVIRRRLFEDIGDQTTIENVVSGYIHLYQGLLTEVPSYAINAEYRNKMKKAYPFHPELIEMFHVRWASHHDFQRTRGVLKLLATIVSDLWKRQNSLVGNTELIHSADVCLDNLDGLTSQIKKLYGNGYDAVISADISGSGSNALRIDSEVKEYGAHNLTQGIAATILMGSFGASSANKGVSQEEIKLCVLRPESFNHNSVNGSLSKMENVAHYLYYSTTGNTRKYWFHTKPNINILINQQKSEIKTNDINTEIIERLKNTTNQTRRFNILINPAHDIPEQQKPTIIILHPKYQANGGVGNVAAEVQAIATKKGNSERVYRNTMLFLICSENGYTKLSQDISEFLACKKIKEQYQSQLEKEQKEDINKKLEIAENNIGRSLVAAYSIVIKNSVKGGVQKIDIKQFKDSMDNQIDNIIYDTLKKEEWLLESIGLGLLKKNNLLPSPGKPIKVNDIYEAFLRYDDKPVISSKDAIQNSILRYCNDGEICIASGEPGKFSRTYYKEALHFFDVDNQDYWLIDKSEYIATTGATTEPGSVIEPVTPGHVPFIFGGPEAEVPAGKEIKNIKISGKVNIENFTQIYPSFVVPLVNNNIEIFFEIKAKSTAVSKITENSKNYIIPKESAKQLGLTFEEE